MDKNAIAKELADLGHSDFRLLSRLKAISKALEHNRQRRCELLSSVACHADTALEPDVIAAAAAPKNPPPND